MIQPWRTSFRVRLLIGLMLPVILIKAAGLWVEIGDLRVRYLQSLSSEVENTADLVAASLPLPLWNFDLSQVRSLLDGMLVRGTIGEAWIDDPEGAPITHSQAEGFQPRQTDLFYNVPLVYTLAGGDETLGILQVRYSIDRVEVAMADAMSRAAISGLTILALIAATVFLVLVRVSGPLSAIARIIPRIGQADFSGTIPGLARVDELGLVARALEDLRVRTAEIERLRALKQELEGQERWRIQRALESTRDAVAILNEEGKLVFSNLKARQLMAIGENSDQLTFETWLPPDEARSILSGISRRTSLSLRAVTQGESGAEHHLLIRVGPIEGENGEALGVMVVATDRTAAAQEAQRAHYLAEHDPLTGLGNRWKLESTLRAWHEDGDRIAILLIDLDEFKTINDTLGHPMGDALLQHVARIIGELTHPEDIATRLGGDEFAILSRRPNGDRELIRFSDFLLARFEHPAVIDQLVLHTGASMGLAVVENSDLDPTEGLRMADLALYQAKGLGRGRLALFEQDLEERVQRRSLINRELRKAVDAGDLYLVYQLQTDMRTRQAVGVESLARWQHKTLGQISPSEFIGVAEEVGLIEAVTRVLLLEACRTAMRWSKLGFTGRISVNLSPKLFGNGVPELVQDCLFETGCGAELIEAEITESVVLAKGASARAEIEQLRRMGISIALDDFGIGYSSLSYLQKYPLDKLKIDRSFICQIHRNAETRAIIRTITDLGHVLGMTVIAEGIESREQLAVVAECGVDLVQGFVDGQPDTVDMIEPQLNLNGWPTSEGQSLSS